VDGLHGRPARYRNGIVTSIKRVMDCLGADLVISTIVPSHVQKYLAQRSGVLVAAHRDLVCLSIVLNWACGEKLLDLNPLGTKPLLRAMHSDHKPRRVVVTPEQYRALRAVAGKLPPAFGVLLNLAWAAGHRVSAMLGARDGEFPGLRWKDVTFKATKDAPHGAITWYAGVVGYLSRHRRVFGLKELLCPLQISRGRR